MSFKLAASDFDGTIYRGEKISDDDLTAIRAWRAAGNKFGIVTGRAFIMLEPHLKSFGVGTDFSICCNGSAIYDGDGQLTFEAELPKEILAEMLNDPCAQKSFHFAFEASEKVFCACVKETSWVIRERNRWNFPLEFVEPSQLPSLPKINQLALDFPTPDEALAAADALNQKFGDKIFAQKNTHSVDVVPVGINKASGVENLLQLRDWRGAKVFVVGDESNDLPMIRHFGGYTVATAKDFVKREATKIFDSVGDLLNNFRDD